MMQAGISVIALNAGRAVTGKVQLDGVVARAFAANPAWSVIYLPESCAVGQSVLANVRSPHRIVHYNPGPGSAPMTVIVRRGLRRFVTNVVFDGKGLLQ